MVGHIILQETNDWQIVFADFMHKRQLRLEAEQSDSAVPAERTKFEEN